MGDVVVIMGVAGSGKTTLGQSLAEASGGIFFDGDDFHPPANVDKMRSGTPLADEDRVIWLEAVRDLIAARANELVPVFIACSALKKKLRDILREGSDSVRFVYLRGSRELLRKRLEARTDHFMPASLLDSQFEDLEPPDGENALIFDVSDPPDKLTVRILEALGLG